MMAAQLVAAHNAAMECYRRAMIGEQTPDGRRENLSQANKLSRTYAALIEALNRHRGKGQQKVTVEHVHVHSGGQAIVGNVEGGGDRAKLEGQPHAITYAPGETLWSENNGAGSHASRRQWQIRAAECTAAHHRAHRRVIGTHTSTATIQRKRSPDGVKYRLCFVR
jgi:hypothetical protein